jgi:hypothetical protein
MSKPPKKVVLTLNFENLFPAKNTFSELPKVDESTFFDGFDLKIGFLGSIYPYPELGLLKYS